MEIGPIVRALRRNKMRFALIVVQIAITLAVVTNAINMIQAERIKMQKKSGFDDQNIIWIWSRPFSPAFKDSAYTRSSLDADLRAMQGIPGVKAVSNTSFQPWAGGGSSDEMSAAGGDRSKYRTQVYFATPGILQTLNVHLVEGRDMRVTDMKDKNLDIVLISRGLERLLFHGQSAVGRQLLESDGTPDKVIGVFDPFYNPYGWPIHEYAVFYAGRSPRGGASYLLRVAPGTLKSVAPMIEKRLLSINDGRNVEMKTISEIRELYFAQGRIVIGAMTGVIVLIVLVTGLGIVGVTSFTVSERRKQIGTRRALGATRRDIIRYFLVENSIVTNSGLLLGVIAAYGLNYLLVTHTSATKLDWRFVAGGVVLLWAQGVAATLLPAVRAAQVSPVTATRGA
jgi:putative ABC transport system permease protein